MTSRVLLALMALAACSCVTQAQLDGIAAKAKIPQECRFIGTTPQVADLGTKKNLQSVVSAMGGGDVIIVTGRRMNPGLLALANTWWGDLYDCDNPTQYRGVDIVVLSDRSAHPVDEQTKEASLNLRVTSNPEAVRGCQFVVNVNDLTQGEITHGAYPVRQAVLRYNASKAGGDIILLTSDPHTGEAYRCAAPGAATASNTAPPPSRDGYYTGAVREMHDEGLLKNLDELKHEATVNGRLWTELGPDRRRQYTMELANYCANAAGGAVSISIFDEGGRQVGGVGAVKP